MLTTLALSALLLTVFAGCGPKRTTFVPVPDMVALAPDGTTLTSPATCPILIEGADGRPTPVDSLTLPSTNGHGWVILSKERLLKLLDSACSVPKP